MSELEGNTTQTNQNLPIETSVVNSLRKKTFFLYCIVGVFVVISTVLSLIIWKTSASNNEKRLTTEKNDLQTATVVPTSIQQSASTTQIVVSASQQPTPKPFNYGFMSPDEFKTKVTNYLISQSPQKTLNNETKVLIDESVIQYNDMDAFSKWLITTCPHFDIGNIEPKLLPFRVTDSQRVECSLSNIIFNPKLAFFSIVPQKSGVLVFVLGPKAMVDGQTYFDYNQTISTLENLPTIRGAKVEIKYIKEWSDEKRQNLEFPWLFAYKNYKDYMVVALDGSNQLTIQTSDLFRYTDIERSDKETIDELINAVNSIKPL